MSQSHGTYFMAIFVDIVANIKDVKCDENQGANEGVDAFALDSLIT